MANARKMGGICGKKGRTFRMERSAGRWLSLVDPRYFQISVPVQSGKVGVQALACWVGRGTR